MKDVLDAIVMVADHPIEYTLEDYAVVFSAKPETVAGQPVISGPPGLVPEPAQPLVPSPYVHANGHGAGKAPRQQTGSPWQDALAQG